MQHSFFTRPVNLQSWHFVSAEDRSEIFFPKLKFQGVKSIEKALEFDARTSSYYWLQDMVPSNGIGIQAEYRDDYKIVTYCDFEFSSFPFESLSCQVTYRLSDLTVGYITLSKPLIYFNFNNDQLKGIKIGTNLPYDIYAEATDPFTLDDLGYLYAATGVTFHLTRNNLGLLTSRFYAPMASFAILAILSFNIHIDAVS